MTIAVLGMNYKTAHVSLRELFNSCDLDHGVVAAALADGAEPLHETGFVVLQTCNRFEVYFSLPDDSTALPRVAAAICQWYGISPVLFEMHSYRMTDAAAIQHCMAVACGIDSLVVGEVQILGQVQHAIRCARAAGESGPLLDRLFVSAVRVGRVARHHTGIHRVATSIAHAALLFLDTVVTVPNPHFLIYGAGEMARIAAAILHRSGRSFAITNRSHANALPLLQRYDCPFIPWESRHTALAAVDVVIVATGADHPVLTLRDVAATDRPLWIIDVAVPRNVEPAVGTVDGIVLANIDDLHVVVDQRQDELAAATVAVQALIQRHADEYRSWLERMAIVDLICDTRQAIANTVQSELERTLRRIHAGHADAEVVVNEFAHRLAQKLMHQPTMLLKSSVRSPDANATQDLIRSLCTRPRRATSREATE